MENNPRVRVYADGDVVFAAYYSDAAREESSDVISLDQLIWLEGQARVLTGKRVQEEAAKQSTAA